MNIEERVEKLESELARERRRSRRLPAVTVLVCLLAFGLFEATATLLAARSNGNQGEIRATSFVLVDENGKERAELGLFKGDPWIDLRDKKGKIRAKLNLVDDEPMLNLLDKNGNLRFWLNETSLALLVKNGNPRVDLSLRDGDPRLALLDKNGKLLWSAP